MRRALVRLAIVVVAVMSILAGSAQATSEECVAWCLEQQSIYTIVCLAAGYKGMTSACTETQTTCGFEWACTGNIIDP